MSAATIRKLEDLPSDGGRTVDTLAGAVLRIFVRLHAIEEAQARIGRRITALEGGARVAAPDPPEPSPAPPAALRRRGRPMGARTQTQHNEAVY
jgi:hypothetical protein